MAQGFDDAQAFWDARYGAPEYIFGTEPNLFLAGQAALFRPGQRALDIACGEGRTSHPAFDGVAAKMVGHPEYVTPAKAGVLGLLAHHFLSCQLVLG